jgi:Zn finger protein HypA/HybF involved in hydrogenase expression
VTKVPDALTEQKERTTFWCPQCRWRWESAAERVEASTDSPHPFDYFATCPKCGTEAGESPQIKSLYRAWLNITGSKSPEISNRNLCQPDPVRTRFNGLKHGMYAKKARYFPAKEGRYAECEGCGYAEECEESGVCLEMSKIKMMVQRAVDERDPRALTDLVKGTQADLFIMLQRMFSRVFKDGETLKAPVWSGTKEGYELVKNAEGEQVYELNEHPLLKRIVDVVAKNNLSLADLLLTPKTAEESQAIKGHLDGEKESREDLAGYRDKRNRMMEQFLSGQAALEANAKRAADPVAREALREIETGREREEEQDPDLPDFPGLPGGTD